MKTHNKETCKNGKVRSQIQTFTSQINMSRPYCWRNFQIFGKFPETKLVFYIAQERSNRGGQLDEQCTIELNIINDIHVMILVAKFFIQFTQTKYIHIQFDKWEYCKCSGLVFIWSILFKSSVYWCIASKSKVPRSFFKEWTKRFCGWMYLFSNSTFSGGITMIKKSYWILAALPFKMSAPSLPWSVASTP